MSFNHTSTFLRSTLLEDPFSLGDLLSPQDVIRIESEYPELFSPVEITVSKKATSLVGNKLPTQYSATSNNNRNFKSPLSSFDVKLVAPAKTTRSSPAIRPPNISRPTVPIHNVGTSQSYHSKNQKAEDSIPKKIPVKSKSTTAVLPSHATKTHGQFHTKYNSEGVRKSPDVPILIRKKTCNSPRIQVPSKNLNDDNNDECELRSNYCELQALPNIVQQPSSIPFQVQEDTLATSDDTHDTMAKISYSNDKLISPSESPADEFHFQVKMPKKDKSLACSSSSEQTNFSEFIRYRSKCRTGGQTKDDKESLLTQASIDRCEQLLLAKLLAVEYERDGKFRKDSPHRRKKRVRINDPRMHDFMLSEHERQSKDFKQLTTRQPNTLIKIVHELIYAEVVKLLAEEKYEPPKMITSVDVGVSTDKEFDTPTKDEEGSPDMSDLIPTPQLTPSNSFRKLKATVATPQKYDEPSASINTPSRTISEKLDNVQKLLSRHDKDVTDCSELEDFVASEPIRKTVRVQESRISDMSPPYQWSTPISVYSEKSIIVNEEKPTREYKSVELQVVPAELETLDLSELESSLSSILDIISEGEFIRSEGKSPGEISFYFSPKYKNFTESSIY